MNALDKHLNAAGRMLSRRGRCMTPCWRVSEEFLFIPMEAREADVFHIVHKGALSV